MDDNERTLFDYLPTDNTKAAQAWHYLYKIPELQVDQAGPVRFLDLGAGEGRSLWHATKVLGLENLSWSGVDIGDSNEFLGRSENAPKIDVYNGTDLPYSNDRFDVVWCSQVLEHVRHPDKVVEEVARVLRPGGLFLGSVSQLEPFHSRSIFNWTHYGVRTVFADHQLKMIEMSPGVDGLLLMLRALFGYNTGLNSFFSRETPINSLLEGLFEKTQRTTKQNAQTVAFHRMKIAGHIHFAARKIGEGH